MNTHASRVLSGYQQVGLLDEAKSPTCASCRNLSRAPIFALFSNNFVSSRERRGAKHTLIVVARL